MFYRSVSLLPQPVRKQLPKDALQVFFEAASGYDNEHDALVAGWAEVSTMWKKSPVPGERWIKRKAPKTLYVRRQLLNGDEVAEWAKSQGFNTTLPPEDMHVTVAFSKQPFDISDLAPETEEISASGDFSFDRFGEEKDAVVMKFNNEDLEGRWQEFVGAGASWDWDGYKPHVTLSYDAAGVDLEGVEPFDGVLKFGPEIFEEVKENWQEGIMEKSNTKTVILKVDEEQRMVYGWASVITEKGENVVDTQGDIIKADELVKASTEFMQSARLAKAMHDGEGVGEVVHSMPLTTEIAKSLGIECDREGWIIGMKIHSDEVWKSVKDGTFKAFSIGGKGIREAAE